MATPLEQALDPGEQVRLEVHARGAAPLTLRRAIGYAAILVVFGLADLGGDSPVVAVGPPGGNVTAFVPVPIPAAAVLLIALLEVLKHASFRSRVYAVTDKRVLMLAGIFRVKVRSWLRAADAKGIQVVGATPEIFGKRWTWVLHGLDAVDAESIAHALELPLRAAAPAGFFRRRLKAVALVLAVAFLVFTHAEAVVLDHERTEARATWAAVQAAFAAAKAETEAAIKEGMKNPTGHAGGGSGSGSSPFSIDASMNSSGEVFDLDEDAPRRRRSYAVDGYLEWHATLLPRKPAVGVVAIPGHSDNEIFLANLRKELDKLGIEAVWFPQGR